MNKKQLSTILTELEIKYGAGITNVKRRKVSPHDPRTRSQITKGGMRGGDRMSDHNHSYQSYYAKHLQSYVGMENLVIAEIGILLGSGLALWSDLFKNSRILGFDIDIRYAHDNLVNLKSKGANTDNIELHEIDQFVDNRLLVDGILKGDKLDIVIDDGVHNESAILQTITSVEDNLSDNFVYFIEDINVSGAIQSAFPYFRVHQYRGRHHNSSLIVLTAQ